MTKVLGPTFGDECITAGLGGSPFSWGATDDSISGRENLTAAQNTTLDSVIAAHNFRRVAAEQYISVRQYYQQLVLDGKITRAEARAGLTGTIPPALANIIATLTPDEQYQASMMLTGAVGLSRLSPELSKIMGPLGYNASQTYDFWAKAVKL